MDAAATGLQGDGGSGRGSTRPPTSRLTDPPAMPALHLMKTSRRAALLLAGLLPVLARGQAFAQTPGQTPGQAPGPGPAAPATMSVREAHAATRAGKVVLVDIRRPEEWADTGVAEGAIRLDMTSAAFEARLAMIRAENPGKPIALICRTANRTRTVQEQLSARGWQGLVNVTGGMLGDGRNPGWLAEKLPLQ